MNIEGVCLQAGLSPRESAVLIRVSEGRTDGEIAIDLGISVVTVAVHKSRARRRILEAHQRHQERSLRREMACSAVEELRAAVRAREQETSFQAGS